MRQQSDRLEQATDEFVKQSGLLNGALPAAPEDLQETITPVLQACREFRFLRLMGDWTLEQHGGITMDALDAYER